MKTNLKKIAVTSVLVLAVSLLSVGITQASNGYFTVSANTPLTKNLSYGSTGNDVLNLQTFLASNSDIYPSGLVTGWYGPLTEAAVRQYQVNYGISNVGVVGPITTASINNTMARQYGIDVYGPTIYNVSVQPYSNSATINWTATGLAYGKVFYSSSPISAMPAIGNFSAPTFTGGLNVSVVYAENGRSVTVSNLQSHTTYYYIIQVTDASGNVSVTQQLMFTTNY